MDEETTAELRSRLVAAEEEVAELRHRLHEAPQRVRVLESAWASWPFTSRRRSSR